MRITILKANELNDITCGGIIEKFEEERQITYAATKFDIAHSVVFLLWRLFHSRLQRCGRLLSTIAAEDKLSHLQKSYRHPTSSQKVNPSLAAKIKHI